MRKIHIGGVFYGLHNIGDEAILFSMINSFQNNGELSVSTYGSEWIDKEFKGVIRRTIDVQYTKPKYGLYVAPKKRVFSNLKKLRKEIAFYQSLDVYICGGATILSDCPWHSLRTVQLAGKSGAKVFLWGVGMAEIHDKATLDYITFVLNQSFVQRIFTRDEIVRERLKKIGVDSNKISISYDPAIRLYGRKADYRNYLHTNAISKYYDNKINIVLTISGEADVAKRTPIDVIVSSMNAIQKKYEANLFLIPTGFGKQCKDLEFLQLITDRMLNNNVFVVEKEFEPYDLIEFLKNVDVIISSRLHMNIFGGCANVPSIGLVRNTKIIDFAMLHGLPYLELENLAAEQLINTISEVLDNKASYQYKLQAKVIYMREQYAKALIEIHQEMNS